MAKTFIMAGGGTGGHLKVAKWLLEVKPDINISADNESAFRNVCQEGHLEIAKWLLKVKPDIAFLTPRLHRILNLPHNLNSLTKDQVKKAFDHLDKELKEYGIYCDLYKSKLSVLHLMKNIYLDRPYECYDRLFESLNAKKMKKFHHFIPCLNIKLMHVLTV